MTRCFGGWGRRLLLTLLLAACASPTAPYPMKVAGKTPYNPPGVYTRWYEETEECLEETGDFAAIKWFSADSLFNDLGIRFSGVTVYPDEVIISKFFVFTRRTIGHEMGHHITQGKRDIHYANGARAICDEGVPE